MALVSEMDLERRARRAYEWGRLRSALGTAALVPPVTALGLVHCLLPTLTLVCIVVLTLAVVLFLQRGQDLARGARVGMVAGLAPLLVPIGVQGFGIYCRSPFLCARLPLFCIVGGVIGGLVLASRRPRALARSRAFWTAASTVTLVAGAVGCLPAGAAGLLGLSVGLLLGAAPAMVARAS
jgi:hypothetical protein